MKKILLGLGMAIAVSLSAQNATTTTWKYAARISTDDPYFGVAVNSKGEPLTAGGGLASNYNFSIVKRDTAGALVWKKSYVSRNQGHGAVAIDANDDLLVVSAFSAVLELNTDTLTTKGVNDKHMFIGKFDGNTGDNVWVKSYPQEKPKRVTFLANGNILLQLTATAGDFYFDGQLITNLSAAGHMFLELSNTDGSVVRHFSFPQFVFPDKTNYSLNGNVLTYITGASTGPFNQTKYLVKMQWDVSSNSLVKSDSLFYKSQYNKLMLNLDVVAMEFDKTTGDLYLAVGEKTDYVVLGTDTIDKNTFALMHYDASLNLKSRTNLDYGIIDMELRDTTLVTAVLVPHSNPRIAAYGNDTVVPHNNVQSYMIVRSNLNMQNRSYAFMATDNWQTGLELRDIEIDGNGNVYVLGFHENHIIFPPHTSSALNRSWKHHSALGMLQFSQSTIGLPEMAKLSKVEVYPNPTSGNITIAAMSDFNFEVYSITGQKVAGGHAYGQHSLNISDQPAGIYLLNIDSGGETQSIKLIKY
jgi:hypothetical protein